MANVCANRVAQAFLRGLPCRAGNAKTDGKVYYLFGNAIARHGPDSVVEQVKNRLLDRPDKLHITWAGWPTRTTAVHLNVICGAGGRLPRAFLRKGQALWSRHEDGELVPADEHAWYAVSEI